ncbi:MAG: hypothetical protein WDW38_006933 [Sanguina aurantia]
MASPRLTDRSTPSTAASSSQADTLPSSSSSSSSGFSRSLPQSACMEDDSDVDECPVECVRVVNSVEEFNDIVLSSSPDTVVVCDFYKTSCGACKYIQPGFMKLCNASASSPHPAVTFLKHNILDDEEDQTDLAHTLRIKVVPLFKFYRGGSLEEIDSFATRERTKLSDTIFKHTQQRLL